MTKKTKAQKKDIKDKSTSQETKENSKENDQTSKNQEGEKLKEEKVPEVEEKSEEKKEKTDIEKLDEMEDKYLRLIAEYDNYRKRTLKEKMELMKSAGEDIIINLLPILDDFERAIKHIEEKKDTDSSKEGIYLIYNKFSELLKQKGVKNIDAKNKAFDTDLHEAITKIPAPTDDLKGKVVDVVEKGYYLKEKVIRYSKVVIGE
ncbi:MAG: nucleotide exchange factor GrpE [Bacteroidales bacterium]|jgi:molecular chaperone GrpE|nr:nucleotide exchange factor GrpE [Bacteroidales bacterium]